MSDELQKSKQGRDIRERLGRKTAPPPSGNLEEGSVAPPPPPTLGGVAPPPGFVGGQAAKRSGPFAGATSQAVAHQEVRIVVDEQAVTNAHEGKSRRVRKLMMITGGGAALLGLFLGILSSTVMNKRSEYNVAVRDGKAVYEGVRAAADQVTEAKRLLDRAAGAAKARPGEGPSVDYEAVEQLRALPTPFTAADFTGLHYTKFSRETVNSLFVYARQVDQLWDKFDRLAGAVLPESRRTELNEAAQDETAITTSPTGCVPTLGEGGFRCGLVYVDMPDGDLASKKLKVRVTRSGKPFEKELYVGQDLRQNASNYVILTNPEQSAGVLGQRKNAFASYRRDLAELSRLMDSTLETQGSLEKGLGAVAGLEEIANF
ncbi:MAG: hypothetical protein JRG67_03470 [Deltaproteobacteria bacterium]|nr:hypothetical protein [Deltaproteobacteria bacterium]MBW1874539.1 hypothetical protein [Deltaproteobacteria bacterium]MBW2210094.1 hypothetical protein [Deltaproteobacteria bacterium]MBW2212904.1 hypothetical protein [Deltaproteobacteria bacterium]MBW2377967.1 hypothetical protein [Deltaproteobacteria bacterium]